MASSATLRISIQVGGWPFPRHILRSVEIVLVNGGCGGWGIGLTLDGPVDDVGLCVHG